LNTPPKPKPNNSLNRRVAHLSACASTLKRRGAGLVATTKADRGAQAELGGAFGIAPLPAAVPAGNSSSSSSGAPPFFEYRRPFRRIDWRRLHAVDARALAGAAGASGAGIMACFADAAFGDAGAAGGSGSAWLAEGDLLKLVEVCQLQLQYLHWRAAHADAARAALEARCAALARAFPATTSFAGGGEGSEGGKNGGSLLDGAVRAVEREVAALGTVNIEALLDEARKAERGLAAAEELVQQQRAGAGAGE
jgi:hypothetical protein